MTALHIYLLGLVLIDHWHISVALCFEGFFWGGGNNYLKLLKLFRQYILINNIAYTYYISVPRDKRDDVY